MVPGNITHPSSGSLRHPSGHFHFFPPILLPSLPHRENPRTSPHLLHSPHPGGSTGSSFPAFCRSSIESLISASALPPISRFLVLTYYLGLGWGQYQGIHLAFPTMIALTPQTSDPVGFIAPTAKCITGNYQLGGWRNDHCVDRKTRSAHCEPDSIPNFFYASQAPLKQLP